MSIVFYGLDDIDIVLFFYEINLFIVYCVWNKIKSRFVWMIDERWMNFSKCGNLIKFGYVFSLVYNYLLYYKYDKWI